MNTNGHVIDTITDEEYENGEEEVIFESSDQASYLKRKSEIIDTVLSLDADIINLQEYWFGNEQVKKLFRDKFSEAGYYITELR